MKLISMHVDNFGCLHNFDFDFDDGLNVILHDNGWGKTTMATFLKTMLYGFDTKRSKDITENERKRYLPWQGGKYGGSLDFEAAGKQYRLFRTFGETPRHDRAKLTLIGSDAAVEIEANKVGETLFRLDANAFQRSVYINQNGLSIDGAASSIHTRLNAMVSQANDVAAFDGAIARLTQQVKIYEKTGSRGLLGDATRQIAENEREKEKLESDIADQDHARDRIAEIDKLLGSIAGDIVEKRKKLEELSGEAKKREATRKHLQELDEQIAGLDKQIMEITESLGGQVPEKDEIDSVKHQNQAVIALTAQLNELTDACEKVDKDYALLMQLYNGKLPATGQLDEIQGIFGELQGIRSTETEDVTAEIAPEGYTIINQAAASDADYVKKLEIVVGYRMPLQQYIHSLEAAERDIANEQKSWDEKKKSYGGYTGEVKRLESELASVRDYVPEIMDPMIADLTALQESQRVLVQKESEQTAAMNRERESWNEKRQRYGVARAETMRLQAEVDAMQGYRPEVIDPVIADLETQQKKRSVLHQQEADQNAAITRETSEWVEKKNKFASLKKEMDHLEAETERRKNYGSESVKQALAGLDDIQRQQQLVDVRQEELLSDRLTTEQEALLARYPGELPDLEEANATLRKFRDIDRRQSDTQGLSAKLAGEQFRADSLKASIDQLGDVSDIPPVEEPKKSSGKVMIGVGIAIAIIGIILIFVVAPYMAVMAAVGAALVVAGIANNAGYKRKQQAYEDYISASAKRKEDQRKKNDLQSQLDTTLASIASIQAGIDDLNDAIKSDQADVDAWAVIWLGKDKLSEERITAIIEDAGQVAELRKKEQDIAAKECFIAENKAQIVEKRKMIDDQYPELNGMNTGDAMERLRAAETDAKLYAGQLQTARKSLNGFLVEVKLDAAVFALEESPAIANMQAALRRIQSELGALEAERSAYDERYPVIVGMDYDDALRTLRSKAGEYKVADSQLQAAIRNEEKVVQDSKVDAIQLQAENSPLLSVMQETIDAVRAELNQAKERRALYDKACSDIEGMTIEEAIKYLRNKEGNYKVINGQLLIAQKNLQKYLEDNKTTEAEFAAEESPKISALMEAKEAASQKFNLMMVDANAVLTVVDLTMDATNIPQTLQKVEQLLGEYRQYSDKLKDRAERQEKKQAQLAELQARLTEKLTVLQGRYDGNEIPERLKQVREDISNAAILKEKSEEGRRDYQKLQKQLDDAKEAVSTFIVKYVKFDAGDHDVLSEVYARTSKCSELAAAKTELEKQRFSKEQQGEMPEASDIGKEEAELKAQIEAQEIQKSELLVEYTQQSDFIRLTDKSLEQYPDLLAETSQLYDQKQKAQNTLFMLKRTIQLISRAKENLANRYLGRVERMFNNYLQIWLQNDEIHGILDIDFKISVEDNQKVHLAEGYSTGYCDLIDLCMRLALVDTLFEEESPFLILDDPFVNLDEDRLDKSMDLLQLIASDKQIIYFVCHPVRSEARGLSNIAGKSFSELIQGARKTESEMVSPAQAGVMDHQMTGREKFHIESVPHTALIAPVNPDYIITTNIFDLEIEIVDDLLAKDAEYEVFFIDALGRILNDRLNVEVINGKLSTNKLRFCLNVRVGSGDKYELIVRRADQPEYAILGRTEFKSMLADFSTLESRKSFFIRKFQQSDILDITPYLQQYGTEAIQSALKSMEENLDIIEFEENQYINIRKLETAGVKKNQLRAYGDAVADVSSGQAFFTVKSLQLDGFVSPLDDLGFGEVFYAFLLSQDRRFAKLSVGKTAIFSSTVMKFDTADFLVEYMSRIGVTDMDSMLDDLERRYGIVMTRSGLLTHIKDSSLYYDKVLDYVYKDYETYYQDV